jgi:hypothetical protein
MTQPESGFENDPYKEIVESFLQEMGVISRAIDALSGGSKAQYLATISDGEQRERLQQKFPKITNHRLRGSKVRITLLNESGSSEAAISYYYPWKGGESAGDEPIEGVISEIYPGIGIYIKRGPELRDARFVQTTSYIDGEPTSEIVVLSIFEPQNVVT